MYLHMLVEREMHANRARDARDLSVYAIENRAQRSSAIVELTTWVANILIRTGLQLLRYTRAENNHSLLIQVNGAVNK